MNNELNLVKTYCKQEFRSAQGEIESKGFSFELSHRSDIMQEILELIEKIEKDASVKSKIDWTLAPSGTKAWAKDEDGNCHWYIGGAAQPFTTRVGGKWLCEAWVLRESAPDFGFDCNWDESICHRPVEDEINELWSKVDDHL